MKSGSALAFSSLLFAASLAAADRKVTFRIEGMTCDGCASAVEVQLGQTEGVKGYAVSFEDAEARVSYDPERTTLEKIAASIGLTGFRAFVKATAPKLTLLRDSLGPLVSDFNAARGAPRFVAILSPGCSLCLHGAEALRDALLHDGAAPMLQLFVVWAPMLPGDDERAAEASSALLEHARVLQYWDPGRRAGSAFRKDVFPDAVAQMRASLPEGHSLRKPFATRDPAQPEWDIYLFFGPETDWKMEAPRPARFVRQVARIDERSSVLWRNDYAEAPLSGSLKEELRKQAAALLER